MPRWIRCTVSTASAPLRRYLLRISTIFGSRILCLGLEKAKIYGERTDDIITNLEASAHVPHRNSGSHFLAMQFGFGPS